MALAGIPRELWALAEGEEVVDFADLDAYRVENGAENPRVKFFDLRRLASWKTPQDEFFVFHQTRTVEVRKVDHLFTLFQRPQFARNADKCHAGCGLQDCPPVRIEVQTVLPHF